MSPSRGRRTFRFLSTLSEFERFVVVAHNNPDPDAIATGWAMTTILEHCLGRPSKLVAGGAIIRSENVRMVEVLAPPLELVESVEADEKTGVILVDCTPPVPNHLLHESELRPTAVIDHHQPAEERFRCAYRDVRPTLIACSTIATQYLQEQGIEPSPELATALLYGIRTDAFNNPILTRQDQRAVSWLGVRFDFQKFNEIQQAPLSRTHLSEMMAALENTVVHRDAAFCFLPRASYSEIVAELCDVLIRVGGIRHAICCATVGDDTLVSVRVTEEGRNASQLVQRTLKGIGQGGGHGRRAGGKIRGETIDAELDLPAHLRERWASACGFRSAQWEPLLEPELVGSTAATALR